MTDAPKYVEVSPEKMNQHLREINAQFAQMNVPWKYELIDTITNSLLEDMHKRPKKVTPYAYMANVLKGAMQDALEGKDIDVNTFPDDTYHFVLKKLMDCGMGTSSLITSTGIKDVPYRYNANYLLDLFEESVPVFIITERMSSFMPFVKELVQIPRLFSIPYFTGVFNYAFIVSVVNCVNEMEEPYVADTYPIMSNPHFISLFKQWKEKSDKWERTMGIYPFHELYEIGVDANGNEVIQAESTGTVKPPMIKGAGVVERLTRGGLTHTQFPIEAVK